MEQENKENHGKQIYLFMCITSMVLISSMIIFYFLLCRKIEVTNMAPIETFNETEVTKTSYVLKEYNGKIGVFENDSLIYTLDTFVFTLPLNDKKLLKDGIEVSTKEELYDLLEEYY